MARGDAKLWLVIGGGLLAGASVFAWYFLVGNKSVQRDEARKPIAIWSERWHTARECLLGKRTSTGTAAEVLTMREMLGDPASCSLAELGRPEGMASGIDAVEAAWDDAEKAWHTLAREQGNPKAMGPAIEALDKAEQDLRVATAMADVPREKPSFGPRDLPAVPVTAGTAGHRFGAMETRDHTLVGVASTGPDDSEVIVRGPADIAYFRAAPDVMRAVPDPSWGATIVRDQTDESSATISAGALAPDGSMAPGAVIAIKGKIATLLAAFGGGGARQVIVLMEDEKDPVAVVRSTDGGAHWSKPERVKGSGLATQTTIDRLTGAVLLRWPQVLPGAPDDDDPYEPPLAYAYLGGAITAIAPASTPPGADLDRACLASGGVWHTLPGGQLLVHMVPGGESTTTTVGDDNGLPVIAACTRDAVAIHAGSTVRRCVAGACEPPMDFGNDEGRVRFVDVFDGTGVVLARQQDGLIGVWRSGVEPVFLRAPPGQELVGVAIWNQVPTFALAGADGLHLAPMP